MKIKIQVIVESEGETEVVHEVAQWERTSLQPKTLGLMLAEAKSLLQGVQQTVVGHQVSEYLQQQSLCPGCGQKRLRKGDRSIRYRTLFGKLQLQSSRLFHCECQSHATRTFNPLANLLSQRTAPERLYLESKFASLMSYGLTVKLLADVLPMESELNAVTVRNHVHQVAQRLEGELGEEQFMFVDGCERDWEALPRPDLPLTVGQGRRLCPFL